MKAICVEGLTKSFAVKQKAVGLKNSLKSVIKPRYIEKIAVDQIDLTVEQGEMLAFLGPNGAGKSTTIKMLTGILHPSGGEAYVLGFCPWKERSRLAYQIGSVFGQKSQLWYHLPPVDSFELLSRIYELKRAEYKSRLHDLVKRFQLEPYLQTPIRKLSLGERMRCEIVASMLHRPKIIFLDEPTIGLDVVVKQRIREFILEMNRDEGTTIFLTSHDAGDIEKLCKRAVVINYGRVILDEAVVDMKKFLNYKTIELKLMEPVDDYADQGVEVLQSGTILKLSVNTSIKTIEAVLTAILLKYKVIDVNIADPPMEEIITHIYEGAD